MHILQCLHPAERRWALRRPGEADSIPVEEDSFVQVVGSLYRMVDPRTAVHRGSSEQTGTLDQEALVVETLR